MICLLLLVVIIILKLPGMLLRLWMLLPGYRIACRMGIPVNYFMIWLNLRYVVLGEEIIVEIDESKYGKRKYNGRRR